MKKSMLLLLAVGITLIAKGQDLELFLLKAKPDLTLATKMDMDKYYTEPDHISLLHTDIGSIFYLDHITYPGNHQTIFIEYGHNQIGDYYGRTKLKVKGRFRVDRFLVSLTEKVDGNVKHMYFGHNKYDQGGYFINVETEGRQPLLNPIPGLYYNDIRPMTSSEIEHFDSLSVKIVNIFRNGIRQRQAELTAKKGWNNPHKKIRITKISDRYYDGYWKSKIFFLEKYEGDTLLKKLGCHTPDTSLIINRGFDTVWVDKWRLDEKGQYQISKQVVRGRPGGICTYREEHTSLYLTCQSGDQIYYLTLEENFSLSHADKFLKRIPEGDLCKPLLGHYDCTRPISPYRWFDMGVPTDLLNNIKTKFLAYVNEL